MREKRWRDGLDMLKEEWRRDSLEDSWNKNKGKSGKGVNKG